MSSVPISKKMKYGLEYAFVRLLDFPIYHIPRDLAVWIGYFFGWIFSILLVKRKKLVLENLRKSFPAMDSSKREIIARNVWRNLGRVAIEFIRLPKIKKNNYKDFIRFEGKQYVTAALKEQKGIIMVTMHASNWEIAGLGTQLDMGGVVAIARPMKNPYVEEWVQSKRKASGMEIILHRQAVRASLKLLKKNKIVAALIDQNLYHGGVFVDFFGRPAATTTFPALLHWRTGAPILIGYALRDNKGYCVYFEKPLNLPPIENAEEKLLTHTQIITKEIESIIRRYPEQWFWIHNRWKRAAEAAGIQK